MAKTSRKPRDGDGDGKVADAKGKDVVPVGGGFADDDLAKGLGLGEDATDVIQQKVNALRDRPPPKTLAEAKAFRAEAEAVRGEAISVKAAAPGNAASDDSDLLEGLGATPAKGKPPAPDLDLAFSDGGNPADFDDVDLLEGLGVPPMRMPPPTAKPAAVGPDGRHADPLEWKASIPPAQRQALVNWTGPGYKRIRSYQQTGNPPAAKGESDALEAALRTGPIYKGEVYRGIARLDDATFAALTTPGVTIDMRGTASWSTDAGVADQFAYKGARGIVFQLAANKSGVDLRRVGGNTSEKEILAPRGVKYRVTGVTQRALGVTRVDVEEV